ncbi:MAG: TerB family tellurite resistance protein [Muribaculaceae bacterium]
MSFAKWIGGCLGWIATGSILGGLAGYGLGSLIDHMFEDKAGSGESAGSAAPPPDGGSRNGFLFSLMVLLAHVIGADGKIMHSEMELARAFLRQNFGEGAVSQGNEILLRLFERRKQVGETRWRADIADACREIIPHVPAEGRLQLVAFLCEVVKADGKIEASEVDAVRFVAVNMGLDAGVVEQMLHLGGESLSDAYAVLGLTPEASDDDVRKAYRRLAMEYHPDKVASLGEDVKAAATRKLQQLNNAKDLIYKSRNMK